MVNTRDFVVPIKSVELDDQEHVGLILLMKLFG
jgi:hypothetical protein